MKIKRFSYIAAITIAASYSYLCLSQVDASNSNTQASSYSTQIGNGKGGKLSIKTTNLCTTIPGNWAWDRREFPATINEDGTVEADDNGKKLTGTWRCVNRRTGSIIVYWSSGYVDRLTLKNEDTLVGINNDKSRLSVYRR